MMHLSKGRGPSLRLEAIVNTVKTWSPSSLRQLNSAFNGSNKAIFQSEPEPVRDGKFDVLILSEGNPFKSQTATLESSLGKVGVEIQENLEGMAYTARLSADQKLALQEEGWAVFDNTPRQLQPNLVGTSRALSRSLPDIDANALVGADGNQAMGYTGKGQTIVILDSGFDVPAMNDQVPYLNVINGSREHHDGSGHGSHTATHVHRAAPEAQMLAIQVMNDDGTGRPSDILKGLQVVSKLKQEGVDIDVVNMSLGGEPDGLPDTLDPINRMVEKLSRQGITVVAAAGNSGPDGRTIGSPADAPSSIAVGAALNEKTVSDFSSRGPTDDGDVRPHVLAPGEFMPGWAVPYSEMFQTAKTVDTLRKMPGSEVRQLLQERPELGEALGLPGDVSGLSDQELEKTLRSNLPPMGLNDRGEVLAPGTSFAAPVVSGVLAQLEQAKDLSPEENRSLLMETARDMGSYSKNEQGAGFVDAVAALSRLRPLS